MSELIERIKAAIDEDERIAIEATAISGSDPNWVYDENVTPETGPDPIIHIGGNVIPTEYKRDEGWLHPRQAMHAARHDPARVLRQVAARRKLLAWHPVESRATPDGGVEWTCPCHWDYHMEVYSWHPQVLCDLIEIMAGEYELEVPPCVCRDCTPRSQWAERGYVADTPK